ncbi:MAG: hypothetical protein ACJAV4_000419 [Pontimonas sp.]|jgi:hypothetical protein
MIKATMCALTLMGLVSACTAIPDSGPVMSSEISTRVDSGNVDVLPPGPSAGATQEDILAGFIAAGAAAQDNYRVARSYLAAETKDTWNPNAIAFISSGEPEVSAVSSNLSRYVVPVSASVDEFGRFFDSAAASDQALEFQFVREDEEWRIRALDDGVVLSEAAFEEAFSSYRLYYFSADYRELVADVRWFASRGEVSTKIVRALLAKPTFWLDQGATVSALPEGTALALSPIPVTDGIATVDLTTPVLSADAETRSRMLTQLSASLQQVQGISSARISVNQNELGIAALGEEGPTLASGRDSRLVIFANRRFGYLQGGQVEPIEGLSSGIATLIPDKIFYSAQYNRAVATRSDGLWSVSPGEEPVLVDDRPGLLRGAVDSCGYIWSSAAAMSSDMIRLIDPDGQFTTLGLDIGSESTLVSLELARDDTRVLLVVQTQTGVRVLLAAVTRDAECRPEALSDFVELGPLTGTGIDAAWIDDAAVAVVVRDSLNGQGEVMVFDTGGRSSSLGQPTRPVTLVGGVGGVLGLRLLSEDGIVYQPRGNGWQATDDRAIVLATQR